MLRVRGCLVSIDAKQNHHSVQHSVQRLQDDDQAIDSGSRPPSHGLGIRRVLLTIAHPLHA
jgi:hypothetical protein